MYIHDSYRVTRLSQKLQLRSCITREATASKHLFALLRACMVMSLYSSANFRRRCWFLTDYYQSLFVDPKPTNRVSYRRHATGKERSLEATSTRSAVQALHCLRPDGGQYNQWSKKQLQIGGPKCIGRFAAKISGCTAYILMVLQFYHVKTGPATIKIFVQFYHSVIGQVIGGPGPCYIIGEGGGAHPPLPPSPPG